MNKRKTLAALLTAAMLVTMVPLQAFAYEDADAAEEFTAAAEPEDTPDAAPADVAEELPEMEAAEPEDVPDDEPDEDAPAMTAEAVSGYCGENVTWSLDSGLLEINGTGPMDDIAYDAGERSPWYSLRSGVTTVTIGSGVTRIGGCAFIDCTNLVGVTIPDTVTSIGYSAFNNCKSLLSVTIPSGVETISWKAFYGCESMTGVTIPDSVTSIDGYAFSGCKRILSVTFGKNVASIGEYAFNHCQNLKTMVLPDSLETIKEHAFYYCDGLVDVSIPDGVTSIGNDSFSYCSGLESVKVGNGVTSIGGSAFYSCQKLRSVMLGNHVASIGGSAFNSCKSLTSVTIPDSVTSIGNYAFDNCTGLTSVTIPDSVTSIGSSAFENCTRLASVTIGNSVTSIGSSAFKYCTSLESVVFGDAVKSIGSSAFENCTSLASVSVPDRVAAINSNTFKNCTALENVTIPDSVRSIGQGAFLGCTSLASVTIPDSVKEIGSFSANVLYPLDGAFEGCTSLTSVNIPDSVTDIGDSTFDGCTSLASVIIPDSVTKIGSSAFQNCKSLMRVTIPDSVKRIKPHTFRGCTGLTNVTISESAASIDEGAFLNCSSLTGVIMPGSVTSIGNNAFSGCTGLLSVSIPDSVNKLGSYAFNECSSLTAVKIGDGVTEIGGSAFYNCKKLKTVSFGSNVTNIGDNAFYYCTSLADIVLPESVKKIGEYAFYKCSSMGSVTIGCSMENIVDYAFGSCSGLTDVYYTGSAAQWREISIGSHGNSYLTNAALHCDYVPSPIPAIITQPQNVTASIGDTAVFSVGVTGSNLTYQWQYKTVTGTTWSNNNTMTGCKTATLSVPVTAGRDGYSYRCKVTDGAGNVIYSDAAKLTVKAVLAITAQPKSVTASVGDTAKFTVTATGSNLTYQWQYKSAASTDWKNNTTMTGCKTATLSVPVTAGRDGYSYRCKITDSAGNVVYSDAAKLTVKVNLAITSQPKSVTASVGDTAKFTVTSTGSNLTYQWQFRTSAGADWKNNTTMTGCKTAALSVPVTAARNGYQYRCAVTSGSSTIYSNPAVLTVKESFAITAHPKSVTAEAGTTAKFTVTATGSNLTYQWQYKSSAGADWKNNTTMTGCQTAALSVPVTAARSGYQYRCAVTSGSSTIYSNPAVLTVKQSLAITAHPRNVTVLESEIAEFTVAAVGTGLSYQWQYKAAGSTAWANTTLGGYDTDTLAVLASSGRNGYSYRCAVTDGSGTTVYSSGAMLAVEPASLAITAQPKNITVSANDVAVFSVTAVGEGLTYRWQYRAPDGTSWAGTTLSGYKTATLSVPATAGRDGYSYRCRITDSAGNVDYSDAAVLTVRSSGLAITGQPQMVVTPAGSTAQFTVTATGSNLTYQWQYKVPTGTAWGNTSMEGNKTATLSVSAISSRNAYSYRCKITDSAGNTIYSEPALLVVY